VWENIGRCLLVKRWLLLLLFPRLFPNVERLDGTTPALVVVGRNIKNVAEDREKMKG